jgi:hypothetical protein
MGIALARVGLKDFDAAMVLSPAGEEEKYLRESQRVSIVYIRSRLVNPSSHQVRNGNCPSIRGRANRRNGKYVARYRQEAGSDRS